MMMLRNMILTNVLAVGSTATAFYAASLALAYAETSENYSMTQVRVVDPVGFGFANRDRSGSIYIEKALYQPNPRTPDRQYLDLRNAAPAVRLKNLIAYAEAGRDGYDAVQYSAKIKPLHKPTEMTFAEIFQWIKSTPRQHHAIGRYQFIPETLRNLIRRAGLPMDTIFSAKVQEDLANLLLLDAGYEAYTSGKMSRKNFMNNLAAIWAGLPTSSGRSKYHGYAGNQATISWDFYETEVARIFN